MTQVIDASALLAWLHDEPGGEQVARSLEGSLISSVNWSETVQKALRRGVDVDGMQGEVIEMGLGIEPFTARQAELAALLWPSTRHLGLSLADRACLALAMDKLAAVLTADRAWLELKMGLDIRCIR